MVFNLLHRHVDGLFRAVFQAKISGIADDRQLFAFVFIFDPREFRVAGQTVVADQFAFADVHGIRYASIGAGAQAQLFHALVADDERAFPAFAPAAVRGFDAVVERHHIGIAKRRFNRQIVGRSFQSGLNDRHRRFIHCLLQIHVGVYQRND